jgi:hypothetical protein
MNRDMFRKFNSTSDVETKKVLLKRISRNKRKIATLLEELSLRTSRIQAMKNKLHGISDKMRQLEQLVAKGPEGDMMAEDVEAAKQELGLKSCRRQRALERDYAPSTFLFSMRMPRTLLAQTFVWSFRCQKYETVALRYNSGGQHRPDARRIF